MAQVYFKMKTALFDYSLPKNLIANSPISPRDHSKLMVIDRKNETIAHKHFYDLVDLLDKNDVLVLNNTKVFPARFFGKKETGGKLEILLNKSVDDFTWEALTKPGIKVGVKVLFSGFSAEVIKRDAEIHYLKFNLNKNDLLTKLTEVGITPLPPYINPQENENILRKEYQTVYAKSEGSVAAPTAGFHFTKDLIKKLKLQHCVYVLGWKKNVLTYLKKASLFVFASHYEGFGLVLLEAMGAGLPVISTDTPYGPSEILDNGKFGVLLPMKTPDRMAQAIEGMYFNTKS